MTIAFTICWTTWLASTGQDQGCIPTCPLPLRRSNVNFWGLLLGPGVGAEGRTFTVVTTVRVAQNLPLLCQCSPARFGFLEVLSFLICLIKMTSPPTAALARDQTLISIDQLTPSYCLLPPPTQTTLPILQNEGLTWGRALDHFILGLWERIILFFSFLVFCGFCLCLCLCLFLFCH